jgi:hypothetical protein
MVVNRGRSRMPSHDAGDNLDDEVGNSPGHAQISRLPTKRYCRFYNKVMTSFTKTLSWPHPEQRMYKDDMLAAKRVPPTLPIGREWMAKWWQCRSSQSRRVSRSRLETFFFPLASLRRFNP